VILVVSEADNNNLQLSCVAKKAGFCESKTRARTILSQLFLNLHRYVYINKHKQPDLFLPTEVFSNTPKTGRLFSPGSTMQLVFG